MGYEIREARKNWSAGDTVSVTASTSTSGIIKQPGHEFVGYSVSALASSLATLTFYVSYDGITFYALNNSSNNAVTQAVTVSKSYLMPAETKPFPFVMAVGDTGTCTLVMSRKG